MPIPLALVAVAAAGAASAGAFSKDPKQPDPRNYAQETRDTLQARIDLAPAQYASEAQFQPLYNALSLDEFKAALLGRPGGKKTETYYENVPYQVYDNPNGSANGLQGTFHSGVTAPVTNTGGSARGSTHTEYRSEPRTREVDVPAQSGMLDLLQQNIAPRLREMQTADRSAELDDIANLGPKAMESLRAANPDGASLVDMLVSRSKANLNGGLDPAENRLIQQNLRAAQADRGVGYGPADVFDELYKTSVGGEDIIRNRALQALGASQTFYGNPFETILQRQGAGAQSGSQAQSMAALMNNSSGPKLFNPESSYAQDVNNTNFNAQAAAAISGRNNQSALLSALIGSVGSAGGSYLGAL